MYCFQDGSEVISVKREATDTQQEQEKSAVAITFPEMKAEEEVSCISLYPLLFRFSNTLCCQNTFIFCYAHECAKDFQTPCVVRTLLFSVIHMSAHNTYI